MDRYPHDKRHKLPDECEKLACDPDFFKRLAADANIQLLNIEPKPVVFISTPSDRDQRFSDLMLGMCDQSADRVHRFHALKMREGGQAAGELVVLTAGTKLKELLHAYMIRHLKQFGQCGAQAARKHRRKGHFVRFSHNEPLGGNKGGRYQVRSVYLWALTYDGLRDARNRYPINAD